MISSTCCKSKKLTFLSSFYPFTHKSSSSGYTLLETIFVMLAIASFTAGVSIQSLSIYHRYCLSQTITRIEQTLIEAKYDSLANHEHVAIALYENHFTYDSEASDYFGKTKLTNQKTITYNDHGNINEPVTLVFRCQDFEQSLVLWLGPGIYEHSEIRLRHD